TRLSLPLSSSTSMLSPPPPSTLFPYTTLFRSDLGTELQERPVALVGLDDQPLPRVPCRAGADLVQLAADDERRPQAALHQDESQDRKSTRLNSSHVSISYAVFCLKKKTKN